MPFSYNMLLTCQFDDQKVEFHKDFDSPVQFRAGDLISINGLNEGRVASVVWYLDEPGSAVLEMEDQNCEGLASNWSCILEDMDYSLPRLAQSPHCSAPLDPT